jgi:hypothetical protein
MLEITKVRISPLLPLIGKDLDAEATFNADVLAAQEDLLAGTIMAFNGGTGLMQKATAVQISDFTQAFVIGILAADSYAALGPDGQTPVVRPAMIYRGGTFIRSTVNEVNGMSPPAAIPPILPGDPLDRAMNIRGLYLEESYDEPAMGVPPLGP